MAAATLRRASVVCLAILFFYYEIYRWVPLRAWSGEFYWPVHNDQFYLDILIGALLIWIMSSFHKRRIASMWIGVALLMLWLGVHLHDWWIPYINGTSPERAAVSQFNSSRTQLLPVIGNHHPPDGGDTILDALIVFAWIVCAVAAFRTRRKIVWFIP
jgi:hypothetical protein